MNWATIIKFHEAIAIAHQGSKEGLQAIKYLGSFFSNIGCEEFQNDHPLFIRLQVGSEPNYKWLTCYARKLLTASSIKGFRPIAKRLCGPEFIAANYEMEATLMLHQGGLNVSFVDKAQSKTPDLMLKLGETRIAVEVTSLNPPEEERRVSDFVTHLSSMNSPNITLGGYINRPPTVKQKNNILSQVEVAVNRVKMGHGLERVAKEGIATIYIATRDQLGSIPEDCRDTFTFNTLSRRSEWELINQKIEDKKQQLFHDNGSGLLFLNTLMMEKIALYDLFKKTTEEVLTALASYPKLIAIVLTVPDLGIEVVSSSGPPAPRRECNGSKVFLEFDAGSYQNESILIWVNRHAEVSFPKEIMSALENYHSNLAHLTPLPQ